MLARMFSRIWRSGSADVHRREQARRWRRHGARGGRSAPDGHTIMIAPTPTVAVNVTLFKKLPYDPLTDFMPLAMAAETPFVLVVNPLLPVKSVADLIN